MKIWWGGPQCIYWQARNQQEGFLEPCLVRRGHQPNEHSNWLKIWQAQNGSVDIMAAEESSLGSSLPIRLALFDKQPTRGIAHQGCTGLGNLCPRGNV